MSFEGLVMEGKHGYNRLTKGRGKKDLEKKMKIYYDFLKKKKK